MDKEIKIVYSKIATMFSFFFILIGWITFIVVLIISFKQEFQLNDWIGMGIAFMIYVSIDLIFILGVLKHAATKIKLNDEGMTIKKPFKKEQYIAWTNIKSISKGLVPTYLYGPAKGYILVAKSDAVCDKIYLIESKKVKNFIHHIKTKYEAID